jgi:hypothetical protein
MFSADVQVGRLLEVRLAAPVTPDEIDQLQQRLLHLFREHGRVILVADYSRATIFSPEVAAKMLSVFRTGNDRLDRSAALVSQSAIFSLQVERMIAQAANPRRRSFHDPSALQAFLAEELSQEEQARLARFLSGAP